MPFALPGETVLASISRTSAITLRPSLVDVLEPSRHRVEPPCPLYRECGGCNLQHLAYSRQVEEKALIVAEAFARTAKLEMGEIAAVPSLPLAYRNRMQLHFSDEGGAWASCGAPPPTSWRPSCMIALRPIQDWIEERAGTRRAFEELGDYVRGKDRFIVFGYGDEVWKEGEQSVVEVSVAGTPSASISGTSSRATSTSWTTLCPTPSRDFRAKGPPTSTAA